MAYVMRFTSFIRGVSKTPICFTCCVEGSVGPQASQDGHLCCWNVKKPQCLTKVSSTRASWCHRERRGWGSSPSPRDSDRRTGCLWDLPPEGDTLSANGLSPRMPSYDSGDGRTSQSYRPFTSNTSRSLLASPTASSFL